MLVFWAWSTSLHGAADTEERGLLGYKEAFVYGLVEGVTEFLPISSTGHLVLVDHSFKRGGVPRSPQMEEAIFAYLIVIQGGAILAVALLYRAQIHMILLGLFGYSERGLNLAKLILLAFLPAVLLGPLLDDLIESVLLGLLPIACALIGGAFLMFWVEARNPQNESMSASIDQLSKRSALMIGLLQCVAMWPGTSRSMMTIVGGYLAGLSRVQAAEFSFLLGLITLSSAAIYKILTAGSEITAHLAWGPVLFGCLVAGASAVIAVRWLIQYLSKKGLVLFAWYRLLLGLAVLYWYINAVDII